MPLAALSLAIATVAAPSAPLQPNGPWLVEAEADTCFVSRSYAQGDKTVRVGFQPLFNNEMMDLIAVTPAGDGSQQIGTGTVHAGPDGETFSGSYYSLKAAKDPVRVTRMTINHRLLDGLAQAATLTVIAKPVNVTVQLMRVDKAMATFHQCQSLLLQSWGVDPSMIDAGRSPTPHKIMSLFRPDDYPIEALHSGIIGRVVTVLQVDASGAVTNCRVVASAGKVLNDGTCRQAMKIRFDPATASDGKPAASIYVLPVRWSLPG